MLFTAPVLTTKHILGGNIGYTSISNRAALRRRASNSAGQKPCVCPVPGNRFATTTTSNC